MINCARRLSAVGIFSPGIQRLRDLPVFLGADRLVLKPTRAQARELDAVVGWGHKPSAGQAREYARRHDLPYLALEDGFLRSVGLGRREQPLSLIVDDVGIYYDAHRPSRLERLLAADAGNDSLSEPALLSRARACRERIVEAELSKYNHAPATLPLELVDGRPRVLVVDQTLNDASIELGLADARAFVSMMDAARREHPDSQIVVKVHPEVSAGYKQGYLSKLARNFDALILDRLVNPIALLKRVHQVYVCTSQLGFEALLVGVPVSCFGAPFYAGWGLTRDTLTLSRRDRQRSLDELIAAALLLYPRYVHPITRKRCEAEDIVEHLALQRRIAALNERKFHCVGFSRWKRPFVRRYLSAATHNDVKFVRSSAAAVHRAADASATLVVWGTRLRPQLERIAEQRRLRICRMEDGFLRSVRLGSELTPPASLVLDSRGIYYDPRTPSDLEEILQHERFSLAELERAAKLRRKIIESGVSKYNVGSSAELKTGARPGQKIVFVPGQVEDDASVLLGSPRIRTNAELLRAVRKTRPDSYIVFKPHPDVVRGNRRGPLRPEAAGLWDQLVENAKLAPCLATADEVHTMTSLVGFEALLRGIPVVTWGQPFYAGWGLTQDMHPIARRMRRLELDELIAGALIRYPRYYSFDARAFCPPEAIIDELIGLRSERARWIERMPRLLRRLHSLAVSGKEWLALETPRSLRSLVGDNRNATTVERSGG